VVRDLCDEAIWMNKGRMMEHGPALEVVGRYIKHMEGVGPAFKKRDWLPSNWYPAATECKPLNDEPILSDTRFGTRDCEIVGVHILDRFDNEVAVIGTGQPLRIVLDYKAASRVTAPIFHVRISRDDGVVCYDCSVKLPDLGIPAIEGTGSVSLFLERLDLNSATYVVDVGCYAKTWAAAYDCQVSAKTFAVRGNNVRGALLNTTLHWEAFATGDSAVLSPEPAVVPGKSA
jgi:lipopolysaccharide transport system ATP-binding protein